MADQEIVYKVKEHYSTGGSYLYKGGRLYHNISAVRRIATTIKNEETHRRRWYAIRRAKDPDGTFTERVQVTKVEILPFALNPVNDNSRAILPKGKLVYECKDEEV